jgi:hypothetical protein
MGSGPGRYRSVVSLVNSPDWGSTGSPAAQVSPLYPISVTNRRGSFADAPGFAQDEHFGPLDAGKFPSLIIAPENS